MKVQNISWDQLFRDPNQPRHDFDEPHMQNMVSSFKRDGQLVPIIVFPVPKGFQLVEGEWRMRAGQLAGLSGLDAVVLDAAPTPSELLALQLKVNCLRKQLTPVERAMAYKKLLEQEQCSHKVLAEMLSVSDATVTTCLALLKLPPEIQRRVDSGEVPLSSAYTIARAQDHETQLMLTEQAAAGVLSRDALQRQVRKRKSDGVKAKRIQCAMREHTITVTGQKRMNLDMVIAALEALTREARRARTQKLDVLTWIRVLRDRAQADAVSPVDTQP